MKYRYKIGIFGELFEGVANYLAGEGFEVIGIPPDGMLFSSEIPRAIVIDLSNELSREIISKLETNYPEIPRITVAPEGDEIFEDFDPGCYALIRRPFTPMEIVDILHWACDFHGGKSRNSKAVIDDRIKLEIIHRETARKLLMNTHWLSAIFEHLPIGILLVSTEGKPIRANRAFLEMLSLKALPRDESYEKIIEKNIPEFSSKIAQCIESGETSEDIYELADGRYLEIAHIPVTMDARHSGVIISLRDLTDEISNRKRLEGILNVLDDGIAIIDRKFKLVWVNDILSKWFSIPENYLEISCFTAIHKSAKACSSCTVLDSIRDGRIHRCYRRATLSSGEERTFEILTGPVRNESGEIVRVVEIIRDVTPREKIVMQLAQTKERLEDANLQLSRRIDELAMLMELSDALQAVESLEENLHIFLTAVTAKQGCGFNRAFLFLVNETTGKLEGEYAVGPSSSSEAGRIWSELESKPTTFAEALANYRQALESGGDVEVNTIIKNMSYGLDDTKNCLISALTSKESRIFENAFDEPSSVEVATRFQTNRFAVVPLLSMGKPVGVVAVDNIITNAPITEDNIRLLKTIATHAALAIERSILTKQVADQFAKLQSAYQKLRDNQEILVRAERLSTIGKLSAQMAHEIRNPLVSIGGFARNISKHSEPNSKIRKFAEIISEEARRLEAIVSDVLSFSNIVKPQFKPTNLNSLIRSTLEILEDQIQNLNIDVKINLDESIGNVQLDPDQMRQVFLNLFKNSISAMSNNGSLEITTKSSESFVWIDIADTGYGIPEEHHDKIFQPFFTTKSTGTGLGLSITYQLVDAHNGMIWFTSKAGKGTTFHIKLPIGEKIHRG